MLFYYIKFKGDAPKTIDFWVLIGFVILFVLIQVYFFLIYLWVTRDTRELKREEKNFFDNFNSSGRNITSEEEADYYYHLYKNYVNN